MRSSGILMHITSLPGPYGVGTMGKQAFAFVDFLKAAGQRFWQILPLSPTGYGDSPYQSCSVYAGNPYLIDLDLLAEEGLLQQQELTAIPWSRREDTADFGLLYKNRRKVLKLAFSRFTDCEALDAFRLKNRHWLEDYALFMALKDRNGGKSWCSWPEELKHRRPEALAEARGALAEEIRFYCFQQYLFFRQWDALRGYAGENGIGIIGDVPIYVPLDSVEVWSRPELFQLDDTLTPTAVAGCPPDGFTGDGQLWGNPLYRWDVHRAQGYRWWLDRLAAAGRLYDVIRLDHFRGFSSYWAVPWGEATARNGSWVPGPGLDFVEAVKQGLPGIRFIAEDLGFLTPQVQQLHRASGWPGMKVLQFAFDPREPSDYLPHTYTRNTVCYTGTHDNMTMRQWFAEAPREQVEFAAEYMHLTKGEGYVSGAIRTAMASVSDLCIIQMQDYLNLGGRARMNFPGTLSVSNWTWRAKDGIITGSLARKIRRLTGLYARI